MASIKHFVLPLFLIMATYFKSSSQEIIPLYDGKIPNSKEWPDEEQSEIRDNKTLIIRKVSRPTLTVYLPDKNTFTGKSVIICPGGGYSILAAGHEGADVAKRFNEMGIAAFVLKYRIPNDQTMFDKSIGPLQDAQRALQLVRENADKWAIDKNQVGIMGFSAGGHLAATAATKFNDTYIHNPNQTNLRPDFLILVYPVVSFRDDIGHTGSRDNLIGKNPPESKILEYSNELNVSEDTPPTFLVHAKDDGVKVENSLVFAEALKKYNVPVKMLFYEKGGHGFGMYNKESDILWMDVVGEWMEKME